jgi:hypothetical protein
LQSHVSQPDRGRNQPPDQLSPWEVRRRTLPVRSALKAICETLGKLDPKPKPEPPAPNKPYVPSMVLNKGKRRR